MLVSTGATLASVPNMAAFILIFWLANFIGSFVVATKLGNSKNRRGWLYWLLGGWIGVIILACQAPAVPNAPMLTELESQVKEAELRAKLAALTNQ